MELTTFTAEARGGDVDWLVGGNPFSGGQFGGGPFGHGQLGGGPFGHGQVGGNQFSGGQFNGAQSGNGQLNGAQFGNTGQFIDGQFDFGNCPFNGAQFTNTLFGNAQLAVACSTPHARARVISGTGTPEEILALERKVNRLEGEQRVKLCGHREGELEVMRGELKRARRRLGL